MNNTNVTSELADMIETYLLNQGWQTMAECTKPTSTYLHLAISIDKLGWDCFVEGRIPISLINVIKPMFRCYNPRGFIEIWGTKFIKGLIGLTHKQWLYRNNNVHYVSEGLTLRQHKELTTKIKILMKTKRSALLGRHWHYMSTNFDELGRGPMIACQVCCQHGNGYQHCKGCKRKLLHTGHFATITHPNCLTFQPTITTSSYLLHHHLHSSTPVPFAVHHTGFKSMPHLVIQDSVFMTTRHPPLINPISPPYLVPYFLEMPQNFKAQISLFLSNFLPDKAPQPYDKICTHLHRLHVWKTDTLISPDLVWFDSVLLWLY